jgi:hypothetical protein
LGKRQRRGFGDDTDWALFDFTDEEAQREGENEQKQSSTMTERVTNAIEDRSSLLVTLATLLVVMAAAALRVSGI